MREHQYKIMYQFICLSVTLTFSTLVTIDKTNYVETSEYSALKGLNAVESCTLHQWGQLPFTKREKFPVND